MRLNWNTDQIVLMHGLKIYNLYKNLLVYV